MTATLISLLVTSIIFFCVFIVASVINYKKRFKMEYRLRNNFPYELNWHLNFKENIYGNMCFVIYGLSFLAYLIYFNIQHNNNGFLIASFIASVVLLICEIFLVFIPLDRIRIHMGSVSILFVSSIALPGGLIGAAYKFYDSTKRPLYLAILITAAVLALLVFILVINPKLSHWGDMDKKINEDGSVSPIRPKYFVLAYTEWILFILPFLNLILMTLILL